MVEREIERSREPEPIVSHYQMQVDHFNEEQRLRREGKRLVKFDDIPRQQSKQGFSKFYSAPHLDHELAARGWTIFDRSAGRTMYDWPASTDSSDGEVTCLIVDAIGGGEESRYRVRCVDGERRTYDDAETLVGDLESIEASRVHSASS